MLARAVEVRVLEGVDAAGRITDDPVAMVEGVLDLTLDDGTKTTLTFAVSRENPTVRLASC